jgi:zinc protease
MIKYENFTLSNGLQVFVHEDKSTPICAFNLMYNVGSRLENPNKTGFAHLFEHLMFGGSLNIPEYDIAAQNAGAENNAFTSTDLTNYYLTLPSYNLERAFWLESDRMLSLNFSPEVLEVQRKVVIEEFKQRYLNQPYGDVWLHLRPLTYTTHPYQWATIGKEISHIENATLEDVKEFFFQYYRPNNAVLVVAGNTDLEEVKTFSQKWFGNIEKGNKINQNIPQEPLQTQQRRKTIEANVPLDMIYMVFHSPERLHKDYYTSDLLSDVLGRGKSSRLYQKLVKEKKIFSKISASLTGSVDTGLFSIQGTINPEFTLEQAEKEIWEVIETIKQEKIDEKELQKVKNKAESTALMGEVELLNRAINLAFFALQGKPEMVNQEIEELQKVNPEKIQKIAQEILQTQKSSILYYKSKKD